MALPALFPSHPLHTQEAGDRQHSPGVRAWQPAEGEPVSRDPFSDPPTGPRGPACLAEVPGGRGPSPGCSSAQSHRPEPEAAGCGSRRASTGHLGGVPTGAGAAPRSPRGTDGRARAREKLSTHLLPMSGSAQREARDKASVRSLAEQGSCAPTRMQSTYMHAFTCMHRCENAHIYS